MFGAQKLIDKRNRTREMKRQQNCERNKINRK
jgi:hypothetical protein